MARFEKKAKNRRERDSLGEVRVPMDALYGAQTARARANFQISGRRAHIELLRAYLLIKRAAAEANAECGAVSSKNSVLIRRAIDSLLDLAEPELVKHFPVDPYQAGAGTSQNMNVNEVIANVANRLAGRPLGSYQPIHANDQVNRSQSTNDTFPTAMRLAILAASRALVRELQALGRAFARKAGAWRGIPKAARTHLQDAVPMRLGQEIGAYAETVTRCARRIDDARGELRELGIGGSAAGTGLTVPHGYARRVVVKLSRLTGEKLRLARDLREAMQSQAGVCVYSSALRVAALELTRICNDLRLLASGPMTGLAEIVLPAVQPGSSIMPGKINPSIVEMANQAWFSVLGYDHTVACAMQAGQLELNVMMPIMAYSMLEATRIATGATHALRIRCVEGIEPNRERLQRYFESTPQVATALSPKLGYRKTAELVKEALDAGKPVIELVREKKLLSEREIASLLDLRSLTGLG